MQTVGSYTLNKRIAALILCSIAVLSVLSVWAITNTRNATPNQPGTNGETAADINFVPNIGAPSIVVPDDYPNISLAVAHAKSGNVIFVKQGIYMKSVTVDKSVTLEGENKETTIVDEIMLDRLS